MVAKQPFKTRSTKVDLVFRTAQGTNLHAPVSLAHSPVLASSLLENTELLRLFGTADFVRVALELGQLTARFDLGGGERVLQVLRNDGRGCGSRADVFCLAAASVHQ